MKKRVSILVLIVLVALAVLGYMLFGGGDFNFGQTNVLGMDENVEMEADLDDGSNYNITLKKLSYDSLEDDTLRFRVEFPEGKESVITFSILDEEGTVVNGVKYSTIHLRGGETSPSDVVLPIEWSEPGTYHVDMEVVDRVSGELVYENYASFIYQ